jgi:hypothetical protein
MGIEREFIPYEQALALKELGFDEPCFGYYTGDKKHLVLRPNMGRRNEDLNDIVCTAPLYQQAFRWFREKYEFEFHIGCYRHTSVKYYQVYLDDVLGKRSYSFGKSLTYEEAELECLKKLISIIKESKNGNN